jgi:hypothetical protein
MLNKDELDRRVCLLEEAQESLNEAIDKIEEAVKGTNCENGVDAYVIPSIKMCINKQHGYLASQPYNCEEIIESLENEEEEGDEDEDS